MFETSISCAVGNLEIVKLLLAHGAEPSRPSWGFPHAPLNVAAIEGHRDVVKALLDAGADYRRAPSPLCYVKDPDVLVLLLEAGADVDAIRGDGDTPLLTAICGGHYEVRRPASTFQICSACRALSSCAYVQKDMFQYECQKGCALP